MDRWPRPGRMARLARLFAACCAAFCLALALPALALPNLFGGQLYYTGGDVTVDVYRNNTLYDEVLQLRSGLGIIDVADGSQVGTSVTLTSKQLADLGFEIGDELLFGIHVLNSGQSFVLGPGHRNADGLDHAYIHVGRSNIYVAFEDLLHGGDRDYNDTVFRFSGGMTTTPRFAAAAKVGAATAPSVPEPSALLLLVSGAGLLVLARRMR